MAKRTLPNFLSLWSSYPTEQHPCNQGWENQCAIRMSVCLIGAGFDLTKYTEPKCKHGHARGAESLANYLWNQVGRPKISKTADETRATVGGKTGLLFSKTSPVFAAAAAITSIFGTMAKPKPANTSISASKPGFGRSVRMIEKRRLLFSLAILACNPGHAGKNFPKGGRYLHHLRLNQARKPPMSVTSS